VDGGVGPAAGGAAGELGLATGGAGGNSDSSAEMRLGPTGGGLGALSVGVFDSVIPHHRILAIRGHVHC
jgi:hypothetical protein